MTAPRRRLRLLVRTAATLALAAGATAVTLEALLRIEARGLSTAALGRWEERRPWEAIRRHGGDGIVRPVPGGRAAWRLQPWSRPVEYRLDQHGFRRGRRPRGAAPERARLLGACRVLALGDSHTFGYGVPAEQAWPSVLETILPGARVANAALCGTGVAAAQSWLPEAMQAMHPHVVVLAVTPWSLRHDPQPPTQHTMDPRWPRADTYVRRLVRYSAVADRLTRFAFRQGAALVGWPPPAIVLWELVPLLEPAAAFRVRWRAVDASLAEMARQVLRRGGNPIVLFIPIDLQASDARNALYRTSRLPYPTHGFVDRDYTRDRRYARALGKTVRRLEVTLVDATPALRGAPDGFLPDSYHLAPAGHARVAAAVRGAIARACHEGSVLQPVSIDGTRNPATF